MHAPRPAENIERECPLFRCASRSHFKAVAEIDVAVADFKANLFAKVFGDVVLRHARYPVSVAEIHHEVDIHIEARLLSRGEQAQRKTGFRLVNVRRVNHSGLGQKTVDLSPKGFLGLQGSEAKKQGSDD